MTNLTEMSVVETLLEDELAFTSRLVIFLGNRAQKVLRKVFRNKVLIILALKRHAEKSPWNKMSLEIKCYHFEKLIFWDIFLVPVWFFWFQSDFIQKCPRKSESKFFYSRKFLRTKKKGLVVKNTPGNI